MHTKTRQNFTTAVEEAASQAATGILNSIGSIADGILGKIVRAIGGEIAGWIAGMISWWPYVVCPVFTVGLGSYGLPPSPMRNLGLMMLGESSQMNNPFVKTQTVVLT